MANISWWMRRHRKHARVFPLLPSAARPGPASGAPSTAPGERCPNYLPRIYVPRALGFKRCRILFKFVSFYKKTARRAGRSMHRCLEKLFFFFCRGAQFRTRAFPMLIIEMNEQRAFNPGRNNKKAPHLNKWYNKSLFQFVMRIYVNHIHTYNVRTAVD